VSSCAHPPPSACSLHSPAIHTITSGLGVAVWTRAPAQLSLVVRDRRHTPGQPVSASAFEGPALVAALIGLRWLDRRELIELVTGPNRESGPHGSPSGFRAHPPVLPSTPPHGSPSGGNRGYWEPVPGTGWNRFRILFLREITPSLRTRAWKHGFDRRFQPDTRVVRREARSRRLAQSLDAHQWRHGSAMPK
jgi:hypothetical protein